MMIMQPRRDSGFALLAVLVLIVLLLAYSIVAQTAVLSTRTASKSHRQGLMRMQQRAVILETVRAGQGISETPEYKVNAVDSPSSFSAPGLSGWPGDVLVTIDWRTPPLLTETYLINRQGRRAAAIRVAHSGIMATTRTLAQNAEAGP